MNIVSPWFHKWRINRCFQAFKLIDCRLFASVILWMSAAATESTTIDLQYRLTVALSVAHQTKNDENVSGEIWDMKTTKLRFANLILWSMNRVHCSFLLFRGPKKKKNKPKILCLYFRWNILFSCAACFSCIIFFRWIFIRLTECRKFHRRSSWLMSTTMSNTFVPFASPLPVIFAFLVRLLIFHVFFFLALKHYCKQSSCFFLFFVLFLLCLFIVRTKFVRTWRETMNYRAKKKSMNWKRENIFCYMTGNRIWSNVKQ